MRLSDLPVLAQKAARRLRYYVKGYRNYWKYTKVPKEDDLWVFSGFRHACYMDNTRYFYEYVLAQYPQVRAVWLTTDENVLALLRSQGKPVCRMDSPEGVDLMSRAGVAFTDHFVMTDYSPEWGLNDRTRVVQLWHGVGFKAMGDQRGVRNTTERGVRYSRDILPAPADGRGKAFLKKIKYRFLAPFREKMERYFVMTDTGQEREDTIFRFWGVPEEARVPAGNPRCLPLYTAVRAENPAKVLYAPTYRFDAAHEEALIGGFLQALPLLQRRLEAMDACLTLRLHPHTWRDYGDRITSALRGFDRIAWDREPDVYATLGEYTLLVTDYSSIAMDFVSPERPVLFLCPDYDWFIKNEAGFTLDFPSCVPGRVVPSWEAALPEMEAYLKDPLRDKELRRERIAYFFRPDVGSARDCARIAGAVIKKLEAR